MSVGKVASKWVAEGISEYEKRITKYLKFRSLYIPDIKNSKSLSISQIKEEEGKKLLAEMADSDYVVLMDERGKQFTSRNFSLWLEKIMAGGRKRLLLVIGGPFGFSDAVYSRADAMISLSSMTFTHEMAKLFATEQIYRAFSILNGEPYHHD